jgi:hypothetical protein
MHAGGGEGGIRTHGPREGTPVFKTGAINRSATSPHVNSKTYRIFFAPRTGIRRKSYQISGAHRRSALDEPSGALQRAFINLRQRDRKPDRPKLHRSLRTGVRLRAPLFGPPMHDDLVIVLRQQDVFFD